MVTIVAASIHPDKRSFSMNALDKFVSESEQYDQHKADYKEAAASIRFDEAARLMVPGQLFGAVPPMTLTPHAWDQIYTKLGPCVYGKGAKKMLPPDFMNAIPRDLAGTVLNRVMQNVNGNQWLIRGYDESCRAVLSADYSQISNTELLKSLSVAIGDNPPADFRVSKYGGVGPDDLNLRTVWKDVNRGGYGIGIFLGNSETGGRKCRVLPMVKRTSCDNSLIIDTSGASSGLELIHRGSLTAKMVLVNATLAELLPQAAAALERLIVAEGEKIPNFNMVLDGLALKYGWDEPTFQQVTLGTENQQTRAGIVNGITYAAHTVTTLEPNEQTAMEILGGQVLFAPDSLFKSAEYAARSRA
jgi:hypothetical protein